MIPLWAFFCYATFESISVHLYLRIIYVLFKRPIFSQPFYRLLIIFGISNLLNYTVVLLFYVLPMCSPTAFIYPELPSGRYIVVAGFTMFFTSYQQDFLYISISLNRLTAVWLPFKQQRIWKGWWIWHALLAHLLALPLTIQYLFMDGQFIQIEANDPSKGYLPLMTVTNSSIYDLDLNLTTIYVNGFCLAICLLFNIVTFVKIYQLKHQQLGTTSNGPNGGISRMERNLSIIALVMSAILSSSLIFQLLMFLFRQGMWFPQFLGAVFNDSDAFYRLYSQVPWVNDLRVLSQPWLLMVVSEDVRKEAFPWLHKFMDKLRPKKVWKTQVEMLGGGQSPLKTTSQMPGNGN